jgi:peroxiredoxin
MSSTRSTPSSPPRSSKAFLILTSLGLALLLLGVVGYWLLLKQGNPVQSVYAPRKINQPSPDLQLTDLNGQAVSLHDHLGEVVLVNNWATWCPPCRAEMPLLNEYYQAHQHQGFTIIAIEAGEPRAEVAQFAADNSLAFPVWLDPQQKALSAFRNFALPSTYAIDPQGNVFFVWAGPVSKAALEKYITPELMFRPELLFRPGLTFRPLLED